MFSYDGLKACFLSLCSPQHQGRLSLDLSQQKRSNDFSESSSSRSSRASHGTNSLPSSARLGQSDTHARTHMHTPAVPKLNATFSICIHFRVLCFSCFWQVLPIMFSTAQRGSKSPLLPATRAPCWAQTEVLCLLVKYSQHTKWLLKYDYWSLADQILRGQNSTDFLFYLFCLYCFQCLLYYCWAWLVQCFFLFNRGLN